MGVAAGWRNRLSVSVSLGVSVRAARDREWRASTKDCLLAFVLPFVLPFALAEQRELLVVGGGVQTCEWLAVEGGDTRLSGAGRRQWPASGAGGRFVFGRCGPSAQLGAQGRCLGPAAGEWGGHLCAHLQGPIYVPPSVCGPLLRAPKNC